MNYPTLRRQALLRAVTKHDGVDAVLVTHPANVTYLTGFTGDSSYLVVSAKATVLVSDSRFEAQIQEECPGLDVHIRPHDQTTVDAAAAVLTKAGLKAVGLEADHATLAFADALKAKARVATFTAVRGRVEALRAVKDVGEVELIRQAVRVAERAFAMFRPLVREADSEKDMADALEALVRRAGGRGTAFPPIVAVGARGALPHAPPTARRLKDGSKLLVDWGADLLYKSDLTRTVRNPFRVATIRKTHQERKAVNFEEVHAAVCRAQDAAAAALRPGATGREVDAAARAVLAGTRLADSPDLDLNAHFTHGLGHGLGLEVHEAPRLRANSDDVLAAGMVVTLEPGVYVPGWGGVRVEDDYLVTKDGCARLSTLPRDPGAIG